ncbi:hypothetical protein [Ramlibacter tataouinensis]|uniref:hypothetical protein n=1 Tax=Ramlibacter tataouinensis TaxID=94132 RepID=UPI000B22B9AC|nr:hypothetical protein [Ramlibacter tataouinensis]
MLGTSTTAGESMQAEFDATRAHAATAAATAGADGDDLFMEGPPMLVEAKLGLLRPGRLHTARRCVVFVLICWVPLCVLAALDGTLPVFLTDMGAFARSWIAGPLLLAADAFAGRELSRGAGRFGWLCSLSQNDREGFTRIVASTLRVRDGPVLEVVVALTVGVIVAGMIKGLPLDALPLWIRHQTQPDAISPAGWWYMLVSMPLLLLLVVGWLWRLVLWTSFLIRISKLDLALIPVHPDRAAGLGFVGNSLRGFAFVAAAFGAIVAGAVANQVLAGESITTFKYLIGGTAAACVVLFTAPLLAFAPRLAMERRKGLRQYGQLATSFGLEFEREWFRPRQSLPEGVLERGDFSAATDLYQVVDRVLAMRFVPVDRTNLLMLAGATLLPFAPVALIAMPFDAVIGLLMGVLI